MRRSSVVLAVLGVLLIAAAAVTRFAIVPAGTKLPGDVDTTVHYAGKGSALNASAILGGNPANAIARNVDMTLDSHFKVTRTDGDTAVVHVDSTLSGAGTPIADNHVYAIDRRTLTEAAAPAGEQVEKHSGLTIAFPVDPKADNSYKYYDPTTQTSPTLTFAGTDTKGGRAVNHYTAQATGPVKDSKLSATLPPVLPKALATQLLPLLPADLQARLAPLAAQLPDLLPLTYTATAKYDLYADTKLGAPIESATQRTITANVSLGAQTIPLLPVLDVNLTQTPASVQELADRVNSDATKLALLGTWLPLAALIIGVLLIGLAVIRRKPATTPAAPAAEEPDPSE